MIPQTTKNIENLEFYKKMCELDLLMDDLLRSFDKYHLHIIGDRMENNILNMILNFNYSYNEKEPELKLDYAKKIESEFILFKYLIQKCFRLKLISEQQYIKSFIPISSLDEQLNKWIQVLLKKSKFSNGSESSVTA